MMDYQLAALYPEEHFFLNKLSEKRKKLKQDSFYYFRKNVLFRFMWGEKMIICLLFDVNISR